MSWRAHPLVTVRAPSTLPMSLPAGTRTTTALFARSVPVLLSGLYFAMWIDCGGARALGGIKPEWIDWSSTR